jgi:hypothetical protein
VSFRCLQDMIDMAEGVKAGQELQGGCLQEGLRSGGACGREVQGVWGGVWQEGWWGLEVNPAARSCVLVLFNFNLQPPLVTS